MQRIHIFQQRTIDEVICFANNIDTSFYESRSQKDAKKRKHDQVIGKLGEFAVYNLFLKRYPDTSLPDLNIYDKSNKSWDYDLKSSLFNMHVKSQDFNQVDKFGISWTFQRNDREINNYKDNDFVSFVNVDLDKKYAILRKVLKVSCLHEKSLFKDPILDKLKKDNKMMIYFSDIKNIDNDLDV